MGPGVLCCMDLEMRAVGWTSFPGGSEGLAEGIALMLVLHP